MRNKIDIEQLDLLVDTDPLQLRDISIELLTEVDRLRAAIATIQRHTESERIYMGYRECSDCMADWPCPTEQAHLILEANND